MTAKAFPLLLLVLTGCFDTPVKRPVDLETRGEVIEQNIRFRYADRYFYGFAFRPTFIKDNFWHVRDFRVQESRAWSELCATVAINLRDSSGRVQLSDEGKLSRQTGWGMTNGSQDGEFPASVSKLVPFTPVAGERYRLRVSVINPCVNGNAVSPHFIIERPMSGP
jgi:hypothetical protein